MMKRILPLLLVVCCLLSGCQKKPEPVVNPVDEGIVVTVNGESLSLRDYYAIESAYMAQYEAAGVDLTDEKVSAYLKDLALSYAVEQMLVKQDMRAQGCYDFDEETEAWFQQTGKETYQSALNEVKSSLLAGDPTLTDADLETYALAYAQSLSVTEQTYIDFYRTQYASVKYNDWLLRDTPVTQADVQAEYEARVSESKTLYGESAAAFETALNTGKEVWYRPEGYRAVLQILLPASGESQADKLASVQPTVDEIYAKLAKGESFQSLIALYGHDAQMNDAAFLATGYQIHQDSVIWEDAFVAAAFSAEMAQPGCWSQPMVSDLGVHILYYLADVAGGPVMLNDDIRTALTAAIHDKRSSAAQAERITELANAAEIVFH